MHRQQQEHSPLTITGRHRAAGPYMPRPGGGVVEDRDEYQNGRFTNVRSPAKGEVDGSGRGLNVTVSILWPAQLNTWLT